jgi:polyphosphate kinase
VFVRVIDIVKANLQDLFPEMMVLDVMPFRLTRNAEYALEAEEAEDLVDAVQLVLEQRRRSPLAVRLEIGTGTSEEVRDLLIRELELELDDVYVVDAPLDLGGLWDLYGIDRPDLRYPAWKPVTPGPLAAMVADTTSDIFDVLDQRDILVQHPYDSFEASVSAFVERAAADPHVLAIKQTLYRTSGPASPIIHALTRAAASGKQVVALIELTARFDEQANIEWAQVLEDAGVHVVYGIVGLKTHAKLTLVVREDGRGLRRYCHLGTGNYNPDTARMYEDIGLLTSDPDLGADLSDLFNMLTGYSRQQDYRRVLLAPLSMRAELVRLIEAEAHEGGHISIKLNSLVDSTIIRALYGAAQAGAQVDLLVRGICGLRTEEPGVSDTIRVRSIVGRYLEHSRIYRFGEPPAATYYVGSADMMPRNLDHRVEVLFPVVAPELRARLDEIIELEWLDDVLAWELHRERWSKVDNERGVDVQALLQERARERSHFGG